LAVRHTATTVERSTPKRSAASRWLACWVSSSTNISYFSLGASRGPRTAVQGQGHHRPR
jgi:hypothetical protein